MEKYQFSQEDYLMYQFYFVNKEDNKIVGKLSKGISQKHDKTFKEVLKDKKEMTIFLKQFIEMEVDVRRLQIYNSEFINNKYEKRIADMIYREEGKEIYYLVEHQSKMDINMPYRILEYCMELMKEINKNKKQKDGRNPLIIPIVIYTGSKKWTVSEKFSDTQKLEDKYKEYAIELKYKLIDINKYDKEQLINKNTKMTSMMLLEKCKDKEELRSIIAELWENADNIRKEWLENLIKYAFSQILEDEEILKIIQRKEKQPMEDLIQRIKANEKRRERKLIKEAIVEVIEKMIKANQDENTIMKFTNVKKEEIDRIRKKMQMQSN